jgi:phage gpG-like protein
MPMGLDTSVDMRDVQLGFDSMDRRGRQAAPFFREAGRDIRADVRGHQKAKQGTQGAWKPRAKPSKRRLLGKLATAWQVIADDGGVELINRAPLLAEVHNYGAPNTGRGGKSSIPAREFAYVSDDLQQEIADEYAQFLIGAF